MSQQIEKIMKKITLEKVVLNIGVGKSGEPLEIARNALQQIINKKPNLRNAKVAQRDWGIRKGEPIGVAVTVRDNDAIELLKRLLVTKDNKINGRSIDNEGNLSFGIKEHIDIPGIKYDPKIGILGLEVSVSLARSGFNIKVRSQQKSKVGKNHRIAKDDTIKFLTENFGVQVV